MAIQIDKLYFIPLTNNGLTDWSASEDATLLNNLARFGSYLHERLPYDKDDKIWGYIAPPSHDIEECKSRFFVHYSNILPLDDLKTCILNIELNDDYGKRIVSFVMPNKKRKCEAISNTKTKRAKLDWDDQQDQRLLRNIAHLNTDWRKLSDIFHCTQKSLKERFLIYAKFISLPLLVQLKKNPEYLRVEDGRIVLNPLLLK